MRILLQVAYFRESTNLLTHIKSVSLFNRITRVFFFGKTTEKNDALCTILVLYTCVYAHLEFSLFYFTLHARPGVTFNVINVNKNTSKFFLRKNGTNLKNDNFFKTTDVLYTEKY